MERILKALVEAAKEAGLNVSKTPIKELVEFMKDPKRVEWGQDPTKNDYETGKAKVLDELMKKVIEWI